jgi:hypothetical protein
VLTAFFPDRAGELDAMAEEAANSRLYGGIHFRSDNAVGLELGRRVGVVAVHAYPSTVPERGAARLDSNVPAKRQIIALKVAPGYAPRERG